MSISNEDCYYIASISYIYIYVCVCVCVCIYINMFGGILWIVLFLKSSSEDVQVFSLVFLLLGQVGKERTLF